MMPRELLHIFRNSPFGRETLLQSAYFCQQVGLPMAIYVPHEAQFVMYFDHAVVTVDLDRSYLRSPETAQERARDIVVAAGVECRFLEPAKTAGGLPRVPADFAYMSCPRSVSDLSSRIGLGYIGSKVRGIAKRARFPVLIPAASAMRWSQVVCFFGGSSNAEVALRCAEAISRSAKVPLGIFTQAEEKRERYAEQLSALGLGEAVEKGEVAWQCYEEGTLQHNLFEVSHEALVVAGAQGHGVAKELLFGSKIELIQAELANPMLIVGPHVRI